MTILFGTIGAVGIDPAYRAPDFGTLFQSFPVCNNLRSLYTQAKSCDHEIVGAQKKWPKAVSRHFQTHVLWSQTLKLV
jgi:hypothetical protein